LISADARYQWSSGELLPQQGTFSFHTANQQPLEARIQVAEAASRGEALKGYLIFNEAIDRLDVIVKTQEGASNLRCKGFPLDDSGLSWCFLLGIPSTAEAGIYSLELRAFRGRRFLLYRNEVVVQYREFLREEIAFNKALSELLTKEDPRKLVEYHELVAILSSFNSRSLFHEGKLSIPVVATRRSSLFADRRLYSYTDGGSSRSLHNGIDLAAPIGSPVLASGAGRVVMARERVISGNSVIIEHLPGVFTLYYHLEQIEVEEGQRLHQGQRIGTVGMTGLATGPHLHWELRVSGVAIDPDSFVKQPFIDRAMFSAVEASGINRRSDR
jgi:murein DD-endopeptidase MepM/ murein hydrolase activator NlpD